MRTVINLLACLSLGSSMLALAEEPANPPQPAAAPTAETAPQAAAPSDAAAPAAAPTASTDATAPAAAKPSADAQAAASSDGGRPANGSVSLTDDDRDFIRRGYQIEMKNGEKFYCKQQDTMGSRLNKKRVCRTPEQMKYMRENAQDQMREKVRNNKSDM
jgi:hypothetical protein